MPPVDLVVLAVLVVAALRGLYLGLARQVLSLVALVVAIVAVRFGAAPGGAWLLQVSGWDLPPQAANVLAGIGIVLVVLVAGGVAGRLLRSGAQAIGLGWLDRGAGGLLGAAEGALVVGIGLLLTEVALGSDHPLMAESQAFEAVDRIEALARDRSGDLPAVAAPPPEQRP